MAAHDQGDRQDRSEQQSEGSAVHFSAANEGAMEQNSTRLVIIDWPQDFYLTAGELAYLARDVTKITQIGSARGNRWNESI